MVIRRLAVAWAALGLAACSGPAYLDRDVVSVAVLPPWNETSVLEAHATLWPHLERQAATHGYRVLPREQVEAYYQKRRFKAPEDVQLLQPRQLCAELQVQGLVYSKITTWEKGTSLTGFYVGVECDVWLVEGATGEQLWKASGRAGKKGRDSLAGLVNSAQALVSDPAEYAPKAAANAFKSIPRPGFAPRQQ